MATGAAPPPGWTTKTSSSHPGTFYYMHSASGMTQWDRPVDAAATAAPVRVSHLLVRWPASESARLTSCCSPQVKHSGSRNPSSWRSERITRSKDEAVEQLRGYVAMLDQGASFQVCANAAFVLQGC